VAISRRMMCSTRRSSFTRPRNSLPGAGSYHGHQEHLAYVKRWLESWDEYRMTPVEFIDAGDQVLVIYRAAGRGKSSGIEVESRQAHLWTIRNGKALRLEVFSRPEEALEAAGLSDG
jgi:ketosteroid isomerase-like protein